MKSEKGGFKEETYYIFLKKNFHSHLVSSEREGGKEVHCGGSKYNLYPALSPKKLGEGIKKTISQDDKNALRDFRDQIYKIFRLLNPFFGCKRREVFFCLLVLKLKIFVQKKKKKKKKKLHQILLHTSRTQSRKNVQFSIDFSIS